METSKGKKREIFESYKETGSTVLKMYVFLFVRKSGDKFKRDFEIIWSNCPDNAYDRFIDWCEHKHFEGVQVLHFIRGIHSWKIKPEDHFTILKT